MAVGIIAEFNPFHNGHKFILETAKSITNERIVAIMSGAFVQRGGTAVTDKLTRARMALSNGADLVIELPVTFSHNTAQKFAMGAVGTLKATGIIDTLAFGSESGDISSTQKAADILSDEPAEVSEKIKELMSDGISYPVARQTAYEGYFNTDILSDPNDILAVEYLRACNILGADFKPLAIKRTGTGHDSDTVTKSIASATEIRRRVSTGENFSDFMPSSEFEVYDSRQLDTAVISNLRLISPETLSNISEIAEGIENKFIAASRDVCNVEDLCMAVKSKRYTLSRIRRIAYSSLIGLTKDIADLSPSYIRVLGANDNGRALLREMKDKATLPVITKPADYAGDEIFNINSRAEDIFALCAKNKKLRRAGNDLRMTPIII